MAILITGTSGYIGGSLSEALSADHEVIGLSRRPRGGSFVQVRGDFTWPEDLARLDPHRVEILIHLAAETGESAEEASLATNVLGTRRLLRYLIDGGCRRFILASSIAAVGVNDARFMPLHVPILESHPLLPMDPYGQSKALMEQIAAYFHRCYPDIEMTIFRFGWVYGVSREADTRIDVAAPPDRPFQALARVMLDDVTRLVAAAVEKPLGAGFRVFNAVGPDAACDAPVPAVLVSALGTRAESLDMSHYATPESGFDPVFSMDSVHQAYGYSPRLSVRRSTLGAQPPDG